MALSDENNEYNSCGENRIIALHKLYQDNGKSFFSAKSESIYDSVSKDALPKEIRIKFIDNAKRRAYSAVIEQSLLYKIKDTSLKKAGSEFGIWIRQIFQESSMNFSFTVSYENEQDKKLIWKKVEGKFKIRLAEIPLTDLSFDDVHDDLFNTALEQIQRSKKEAEDSSSRELILKNDVKEYKEQMLQFKEDKSNLEEKLFEAFIPILNSKKDEIRRLKRKVGELPGYQDDTSDDGEQSDNELDQTADSKLPKMTQIKSTKEKNVHTMSDSDDGSDSHSSSDNLKNEPANNSQDILNMSPTLL